VTWLVWRQYRLQAAAAAVLLAGFAAVMVVSGLQMASQWHAMLGTCTTGGGHSSCEGAPLGSTIGHDFEVLSVMVPAVLGIFFGAPLVAHELESGTSQYAWTQTVTRTRWLTVKAGWLLLAAAVWGGAVAALVTWWSGPRNALYGNQFQPNYFDVQGIVPVGYAVFATALGIAAGTLLRRTLPAIAVVIGVFIGVRLFISDVVRQHYIPAVTSHMSFLSTPGTLARSWDLASGITGPNGQPLPQSSSVNSFNGVPLASLPHACQVLIGQASRQAMVAGDRCLDAAGYRVYDTYQPANRYWAFQGIETGVFVALAAVLLAITYAVVRRRDA